MTTVVVALGGNALGNNAREQMAQVKIAASALADLIQAGYRVVVTHGNGPQVGMIKLAFEASPFEMPLAECTSMSQGYIGYHLQQALQMELKKRNLSKPVAAILTQVVVSPDDPAFQHPTKPIGPFYSEQDALKLMESTHNQYVEDAGRGWRRVVPSPKPVDICEKETIKTLIDRGQVVIVCGGGGIPVVEENGVYTGVDAVIDKDFAAAKLAEVIESDLLFILTAVDRVYINYRQPDEKCLEAITVSEGEAYCQQGHFAPGSMMPKVEASIMFVKSGGNRKAIIGALEKAVDALDGKSGTVIHS